MSDSPTQSPSSWIWLFTGVVTGLFLAFLYYLAGVQTPTENETAAPRPKATSIPAPTFDFYNLLLSEKVSAKPPKQDKSAALTNKTATSNAATTKTKTASAPVTILLQAGSFSLANDAHKRRAELLLLGLNVNIETVQIKQKTYHRVQTGPFNSDKALSHAKNLLTDNGIEHMQRKVSLRN